MKRTFLTQKQNWIIILAIGLIFLGVIFLLQSFEENQIGLPTATAQISFIPTEIPLRETPFPVTNTVLPPTITPTSTPDIFYLRDKPPDECKPNSPKTLDINMCASISLWNTEKKFHDLLLFARTHFEEKNWMAFEENQKEWLILMKKDCFLIRTGGTISTLLELNCQNRQYIMRMETISMIFCPFGDVSRNCAELYRYTEIER